jgi:hypothetical protein
MAGPLFEGLSFGIASADEREEVLAFRSSIYSKELGNPGSDQYDAAAYPMARRAQALLLFFRLSVPISARSILSNGSSLGPVGFGPNTG